MTTATVFLAGPHSDRCPKTYDCFCTPICCNLSEPCLEMLPAWLDLGLSADAPVRARADSPLIFYAFERRDVPLAERLVSCKANINAYHDDEFVLGMCLAAYDSELVDLALRLGADPLQLVDRFESAMTAMSWFFSEGPQKPHRLRRREYFDIVKAFVRHCPAAFFKTAFYHVVCHGDAEIVAYLLDHDACANGDVGYPGNEPNANLTRDIIDLYVDRGMMSDASFLSKVLSLMIYNSRPECFSSLVAAGADLETMAALYLGKTFELHVSHGLDMDYARILATLSELIKMGIRLTGITIDFDNLTVNMNRTKTKVTFFSDLLDIFANNGYDFSNRGKTDWSRFKFDAMNTPPFAEMNLSMKQDLLFVQGECPVFSPADRILLGNMADQGVDPRLVSDLLAMSESPWKFEKVREENFVRRGFHRRLSAPLLGLVPLGLPVLVVIAICDALDWRIAGLSYLVKWTLAKRMKDMWAGRTTALC